MSGLFSVWRCDHYSGQEDLVGDGMTSEEAEKLADELEQAEYDNCLDAEEERALSCRLGYDIRAAVQP